MDEMGSGMLLEMWGALLFVAASKNSEICCHSELNHWLTVTQSRKTARPAKPRASLQPGSVVILLAGRFRGKRVVLLKHLPQGVLLVTGPFKVNGVPLRRVNARYVIATSTKVDISGLDESVLNKASEDGYFTKDKAAKKVGEDAFFKQGDKPEVG
jgi:large subunit ribosomal protein L6e